MKQLSTIHYTIFLLIITSALMHYVYFANTGNFNSPIIDYEFVKNANDVKELLMQDGEFKKEVIQGIHDQNIVDYAYMIIYTSLLFLVFSRINKLRNKKIYVIGAFFSIIALITDIFENIQLFNISELLTARIDFSSNIKILIIATNIKWFSLAIALFILSFHYFKNNIIGKVFALISSLPLIFGILYITLQNNSIREYFTLFIMLGFVILMIWTFISKYINKDISFYK